MLYENTETQTFGITHDMLVNLLPNISFPVGIPEIGKYKKYERTERPIPNDSQTVREVAPVDGVQTWLVENKEETEAYLLQLKSMVKDKITSKRWEVESGGLSFPNGVLVKTSKDDQDRILSVIINAERNGINEIDFKADSGWVKITLFALKQLGKELTYFVQHCFGTEKYHHGFVDSLTTTTEICSYNFNTGWTYTTTDNSTEVLNYYNLNKTEALTLLYSNFIFAKVEGEVLLVSKAKLKDGQTLLNKAYYGVTDLTPTQFYYLLAKSGLDDAIEQLLPPLKIEDIDKYSNYKSYLYGARTYDFAKAFEMYTDIKDKIIAIDSSLSFTVYDLKALWIEASRV